MEQKKQNQQDTKQDYIEFINKMIADMSTEQLKDVYWYTQKIWMKD